MEIGVPFAFATGYGEQLAFPDAFAAIPKLRKPYTSDILRTTLQNAKPAPIVLLPEQSELRRVARRLGQPEVAERVARSAAARAACAA